MKSVDMKSMGDVSIIGYGEGADKKVLQDWDATMGWDSIDANADLSVYLQMAARGPSDSKSFRGYRISSFIISGAS